MRPPTLIDNFSFSKRPRCLAAGERLAAIFFAAVLTAVFSDAVPAAAFGGKTLSIEQAEQMAVETSLEVKLAAADVKIRGSAQRASTAAYYPQIYSRIVAPFVGRESGFFADQIIWDFGRTKNRVKSNRSLEEMAKFSKQNAIAKALFEVRAAFYKVLLYQSRLVSAEKKHSLALMKLEKNRILEKNGRISPLELAERESEESGVLFEVQTAKNLLERARFEIFQLIGIENGSDIALEIPPEPEEFSPNYERTLSLVFKQNPHLSELREKLKSDGAAISAARAEFLPVIYARAAYRFEGEGADTPAFIAGAGAQIPIFKGFSRFAEVDRARAEREKTEIKIALERQRLEREVKRLLLEITHSEADIKLSRRVLANAEKKLILAREKRELGAASSIDLVFSEKEYAKFYLNYEEKVYNKRLLIAELKFLTGEQPAGNGGGDEVGN